MNLNDKIFDTPKQFFKGLVVYIVGADPGIENLFEELTGEKPLNVFNPVEAAGVLPPPHILVFTGGHDVSPVFYGEKNTASASNLQRDMTEYLWYRLYEQDKNVLKVGICRGAQFLNVCNGGSMIQHLEPGHNGTHEVKANVWYPVLSPGLNTEKFEVNSTHHQGIIPARGGHVLLSHVELATTECVAYLTDNRNGWELSFCFQPHPEYSHRTTTEAFVSLFYQFAKHCKQSYNTWGDLKSKKEVRI